MTTTRSATTFIAILCACMTNVYRYIWIDFLPWYCYFESWQDPMVLFVSFQLIERQNVIVWIIQRHSNWSMHSKHSKQMTMLKWLYSTEKVISDQVILLSSSWSVFWGGTFCAGYDLSEVSTGGAGALTNDFLNQYRFMVMSVFPNKAVVWLKIDIDFGYWTEYVVGSIDDDIQQACHCCYRWICRCWRSRIIVNVRFACRWPICKVWCILSSIW